MATSIVKCGDGGCGRRSGEAVKFSRATEGSLSWHKTAFALPLSSTAARLGTVVDCGGEAEGAAGASIDE